MTRTPLRIVLLTTLTMLVGATTLAQRGGFRGFTQYGNVPYDGKFVFVRMSYPTMGLSGRNAVLPPWSHDYPDGEQHFMSILTAVTNVPGHTTETSIISFSDPEMFKFPVIYLCEPGYWTMSDAEVVNLRNFLKKGGFMIVDDFPSWAWPNFDLQMSRVFPELQWHTFEDTEHPIFHSFFDIKSLEMTTYYNLGGPPSFRGLFEDNDVNKRMYVVANYQNDISEYWEFSQQGFKPVDENNEAYKFGVNEFMYGITH